MKVKECKDHLGNTYSSEADMCKFYGIDASTYNKRIKAGWTIKAALTTPKNVKSKPCVDHLGNTYTSISQMLRHYSISRKVFDKQREKTPSLSQSLKEVLNKEKFQVYDHEGKGFRNIGEMLAFYDIPRGTYTCQKKRGYPLEYILLKKWKEDKKVSDHLGKKYASRIEMLKHYGISQKTFEARISAGWTIEKALTEPVRSTDNTVIDHKGNQFASVAEMLKHYGVAENTYRRHIKAGHTLEEILEKASGPHVIKDHKGTKFASIKQMAEYYDIPVATYTRRIKTGWSMKKALTTPVKYTSGKSCIDHLGISYKSEAKMCQAYGIKQYTFRERIKKGWDLKKALTAKIDEYLCRTDHKGIKYASVNEMCKTYGISTQLFNDRISRNWTLVEALEIPRNLSLGEYRTAECLKRMNIRFYHDCSIKKVFRDLNISVEWGTFLEKLHQNLEVSGIKWSKQRIERLRPDFVLLNDDNGIRGVIEFDGTQHQRFTDHFFATVAEFLMRCSADTAKQSLWEYLSIPMLRIRNDQADRIDNMVSDFLARPEFYIRNHNPFLMENEYWAPLGETLAELGVATA